MRQRPLSVPGAPHDAELEAILDAVALGRGDDGNWQVLADALIQRGDTRGELLLLELQLREGTRDPELMDALVERRVELQRLARQPGIAPQPHWHRGFVDRLSLQLLHANAFEIEGVLAQPELALLSRLEVDVPLDGVSVPQAHLQALAQALPRRLRALRVQFSNRRFDSLEVTAGALRALASRRPPFATALELEPPPRRDFPVEALPELASAGWRSIDLEGTVLAGRSDALGAALARLPAGTTAGVGGTGLSLAEAKGLLGAPVRFAPPGATSGLLVLDAPPSRLTGVGALYPLLPERGERRPNVGDRALHLGSEHTWGLHFVPQPGGAWELRGEARATARALKHGLRFNFGQTALAWIEVADLDAWYRAQLRRGALDLDAP